MEKFSFHRQGKYGEQQPNSNNETKCIILERVWGKHSLINSVLPDFVVDPLTE